jgi:hypothetical protein
MNSLEPSLKVNEAFQLAFQAFLSRPSVSRLVRGAASLEEYGSYLRQVFHQTRDNPQLQAHATAYFRGQQRQCIKKFLAHACAELGHEFLALGALERLGIPASKLVNEIPNELPLPETQALTAFAHYQMQFVDPVGYLGMVYFLEFMPTSIGSDAGAALEQMGVPVECRSFIEDHVTIDVAHNRMMNDYLEQMITTEAELAIVIASVAAVARLYGNMIEAAFEVAQQAGLSATFYPEATPALQLT